MHLGQWGKFKYYIVIFDWLQGYSGGLIWAPELCVRGPLTRCLLIYSRTFGLLVKCTCNCACDHLV